ncbi:MAG: hypothetical protein R3Y19_07240 [Rikenellaceae bacterium]
MKAVMITYNQALSQVMGDILEKLVIRGYTQWEEVKGRGTKKGEPHMGTHTWPAKNNVIMTIIEDEKVKPLLEKLRELDSQTLEQGTRAFVWDIVDGM